MTVDPTWTLVGSGKLRRGADDEYLGHFDVVGFPYHLRARVEADSAGKFFALRVYCEPRRGAAAADAAPVQEGLPL